MTRSRSHVYADSFTVLQRVFKISPLARTHASYTQTVNGCVDDALFNAEPSV